MRTRKLLQARLRAAANEDADVAQHGAALARAFHAGRDLMVVPREIREEFLRELRVPERARHEAVDGDLVELHLQADLASKNQQLAGDVLP